MSANHQKNLRLSRAIALTLSLLSCCTVLSNSQNAFPSEHGLMYEKSPGETSPAMIAFFGQPKVELPEAQNIPVPGIRRDPSTTDPASNNDGQQHTKKKNKPTSAVIAGIVFAVLAAGLLAAAAVAYVLHARRSKMVTGSNSMAGLTQWRNGSEVQLGAI